MAGETVPTSSFSARRKWAIGLSVMISTLAAAALVAMINYLGGRHFYRFSLSRDAKAQLSTQTIGLLSSLTNDIKVVAYFNKKDPIFDYVSSLLQEYSLTSPHIKVQAIDYLADPALAFKAKETYHLGSGDDKDLVIFDCNGHIKRIDGAALGDYEVSQKPGDGEQREFERKLKSFKGEATFSAAILSVTKPRPLKAYFLQAHGEAGPRDETRWGYARFNDILGQNFIVPSALILTGTNPVPADCNLLIAAGPVHPLPETDLAKIREYLRQGGRMLICLSFQTEARNTGLEAILAEWRIEAGHNRVHDTNQSLSDSGEVIVIRDFNWKHPLVNPLRNAAVQFISPRSVRRIEAPKESSDALKVDELAYTSDKPYLDDHVLPEKDRVPVMAAAERTSVNGVFTERGLTRILAIGDSYLLSNAALEKSEDNRYFADRLVNWLMDQTEMLKGVPPRQVTPYTLQITRSEIHAIQAIFLAGMPGGIFVFGFLVWLRRRH